MTTILNYLNRPVCLKLSAQIVGLQNSDEEQRSGVIIDATPFYVQGGGQPSDLGRLITAVGNLPVSGLTKLNGILASWQPCATFLPRVHGHTCSKHHATGACEGT